MSDLTLGERQELMVECLAKLIAYALSKGYKLRLGEGYVQNPRKVHRLGTTFMATDQVHMANSLHYVGLAQDLNLFIAGQYITDGGHPAFTDLGVFWESLNPNCAWGGRFKSVDSNHFSVRYGGRA